MSGVDRKVSIRITLTTSLTRLWATAASVIIDVSRDAGSPAAVSAAGHVPTEQLATFVLIADQIRYTIQPHCAARRCVSARPDVALARWLLPQFVRDAPAVLTHFR